MESSAGEGGSISKAAQGLFLEEWDKTEGIWTDLSIRLVSDLKNQAGLSRTSDLTSDFNGLYWFLIAL